MLVNLVNIVKHVPNKIVCKLRNLEVIMRDRFSAHFFKSRCPPFWLQGPTPHVQIASKYVCLCFCISISFYEQKLGYIYSSIQCMLDRFHIIFRPQLTCFFETQKRPQAGHFRDRLPPGVRATHTLAIGREQLDRGPVYCWRYVHFRVWHTIDTIVCMHFLTQTLSSKRSNWTLNACMYYPGYV
jgi:hypothetical protein